MEFKKGYSVLSQTHGFLPLLELKLVSVICEDRMYPFLLSLGIFCAANRLKSGSKMQFGEQAEGGACYWNACGQWDQKAFLMVSQVTGWIGSDVAKEPSEGASPKDPVTPCSWIKSQQMKDNEIQEKDEMFKCWKISCYEPNPAFQNTLTESEFTLVHNSISQGFYPCLKGQPQNWSWNALESSFQEDNNCDTTICASSVCENWVGNSKELPTLFEYFGCSIQTHKHRRRVKWCFFSASLWDYIKYMGLHPTRALSRSLLIN